MRISVSIPAWTLTQIVIPAMRKFLREVKMPKNWQDNGWETYEELIKEVEKQAPEWKYQGRKK